jgi:hypothetical protein
LLAAIACGVLLFNAPFNGAWAFNGYGTSKSAPTGGPGPSGQPPAETPEFLNCDTADCGNPNYPREPKPKRKLHIRTRHSCGWQADQNGLTGVDRGVFIEKCEHQPPM